MIVPASDVFFFLLFEFDVVIVAVGKAKSLAFHLLFDHLLYLVGFVLLVLIELEPCALDVPVPDLAGFSFLHLAHKRLAQLYQIFRSSYFGHLQGFEQVNRVLFLLRGYECYGSSPVAASPCSTDSMDVVLEVIRAFEVDHQNNGGDV